MSLASLISKENWSSTEKCWKTDTSSEMVACVMMAGTVLQCWSWSLLVCADPSWHRQVLRLGTAHPGHPAQAALHQLDQSSVRVLMWSHSPSDYYRLWIYEVEVIREINLSHLKIANIQTVIDVVVNNHTTKVIDISEQQILIEISVNSCYHFHICLPLWKLLCQHQHWDSGNT